MVRNRILWQYRRRTWRRRVLPDAIVIGAMKSGTSSLASYMSQHPQLHPACRKEVHFFDGGHLPDLDTFELGLPWYRAHFPFRDGADSDRKVYELVGKSYGW